MPNSSTSLVLTLQLALLLSTSAASAQDSTWYRRCGQFTCCDSTVLLGSDTVKIIYGYNSSLGLRFSSKDIYDLIQYSTTDSEKTQVTLSQHLQGSYFQTYLDPIPDTSRWKTYRSTHFVLSFRHPPGIQIVERLDTSSQAYIIELGQYAMPDSLGQSSSEPLVFARISFTSENLFQAAAARGFHPNYSDCWYSFQGKTEWGGQRFANMAYLEGNQWKCIRGLELYSFYNQRNQFVTGDSIRFLAIIERQPRPSMVLDFFEKALRRSPVYIFEADIFTLLSSARFDD